MYRSLEKLTALEKRKMTDFLRECRERAIHLLSSVENSDPGTSVLINMEDGKMSGLIMKISRSDYPVLWSLGRIRPEQVAHCFGNEEKFILISDDTTVWSDNARWKKTVSLCEHLMLLTPSKATYFEDKNARILDENDATQFAATYPAEHQSEGQSMNLARDFLRNNRCFGLFIDSKLVARGRIQATSSMGWAIGGVYTLPEYRNRGYATNLVSAIAEHAFRNTGRVILHVREDNAPAIRTYEKIGFRKIGTTYFAAYGSAEL